MRSYSILSVSILTDMKSIHTVSILTAMNTIHHELLHGPHALGIVVVNRRLFGGVCIN